METRGGAITALAVGGRRALWLSDFFLRSVSPKGSQEKEIPKRRVIFFRGKRSAHPHDGQGNTDVEAVSQGILILRDVEGLEGPSFKDWILVESSASFCTISSVQLCVILKCPQSHFS